MSMSLADYQKRASKTAIYKEEHNMIYPALGLTGEAGEIANKVKKILRDDYDPVELGWKKQELSKEIGDVLWYCSALATDLGFSLSDIAQANLNKLQDRANRGKIAGDGDNR